VPLLPALLLAIAFGGVLGWWSYRGRFAAPLARVAAGCRAIGAAAVLFVVLDPTLGARFLPTRPLVLLDNSISMHAATGRALDARALARSLGDSTPFGELAPGLPGGASRLGDVLPTALASGRPVTILTDGEITDAASLAPDVLAGATIRLLPRAAGDDIALVDVRGTQRLTAGDSLHLDVEARRIGNAPDSAVIEVRDGEAVVLRGAIRFGPTGMGRARMAGVLPGDARGLRWLEVHRVGPADAEPADDVRWWAVRVTPTPGIVVLAVSPDWDARFLYRALRDVTASPVRGYAQMQPGQWRRMDDLRRVPIAEVQAAARGADLLAVRGDITGWERSGRARLLWSISPSAGDWYLSPTLASPLAGAFATADRDSLPPATAVRPLDAAATRSWVGATARLARRGSDVPVIGGREGADGRTVTFGADGLYRWAFRGGASDQLWRALIADATAWLLASPDSAAARVRPVADVTQRGRAVRFRWSGAGAPVATEISFGAGETVRRDTLRFDGTGEARIALDVGRHRYQLSSGGSGEVAVEPYADELVPSAVTLTERAALTAPVRAGRGAREWWPLFLLAVVAFGSEWLLRRRLGMR
jgi:hypothetical protein